MNLTERVEQCLAKIRVCIKLCNDDIEIPPSSCLAFSVVDKNLNALGIYVEYSGLLSNDIYRRAEMNLPIEIQV
jgi:hypothetical protein